MFVHANTVEALRQRGAESLPLYESAFAAACKRAPPVYGQAWYGELYRDVARQPEWLAQSLIDNAAKEGEGAKKLWALSSRCSNPMVADAIRVHAVDESRHAMLYVAMCEMVFPNALDLATRSAANALSPGFKSGAHPDPDSNVLADGQLLDELTQMNIGEIRTRIHQLLMRPVIRAYCPEETRPRLQRVLDGLLRDETRHIEYTARLIEKLGACRAQFAKKVFTARLAEFNEITLREVGNAQFVGE